MRGPVEEGRAALFTGPGVLPMKKGFVLAIFFVLLGQALMLGGGPLWLEPKEAASSPFLELRPIHPLPEWNGQENIRPRTGIDDEGSSGRVKITFPVALLVTLLFFLMWKFMQGQE